ncbi:hypothetical protein AB1Y20_005889 [Prymnesium parvum]|uniref:J domain-containing protein n=1 Tax=Prymnesium parvum TaxID=97485 RepID=A0AB34J1N5_PRYPA
MYFAPSASLEAHALRAHFTRSTPARRALLAPPHPPLPPLARPALLPALSLSPPRPTALTRRAASARAAADAWATLGLRPGADLDACKRAFRQLALSHHPDTGGDAQRFAALVHAYEQLEAAATGQARVGARSAVRSVGGMLVASVEELKADPAYEVFTVRLSLESEASDRPKRGVTAAGGAEVALEVVYEVTASEWDSVADLRARLQERVDLPDGRRHGNLRNRLGGHEIIYKGQLMAEHLLLADYELNDGDILHFAARRDV